MENVCDLAHQLLTLANRGTPRIDFLRASAKLFLTASTCDALEMWLKEDGKCYRFEAAHRTGEKFLFDVLPHVKHDNHEVIPSSQGQPDFVQLCDLICRNHPAELTESSFPFSNDNGSYWTNAIRHPLFFTFRMEGKVVVYELHIEGDYRSMALVSIPAYTERIGLLCLKSKESNVHTPEAITYYERIAQLFGDSLINRRAQVALRERVKELTCLYKINRIVQKPETSLENILNGITAILPPAWFYPEIAFSRIVLDGRSYLAPGFHDGAQRMTSNIVVNGVQRGAVEVVYSTEMPELDEGPFLKEERNLLDAVANELSLIIERLQITDDKIKLQEQLRHADRLATIGQLAAGVAHELNEPLGNILGFAQLAKKSHGLSRQTLEDIDKIVNSALHSREVIKKLLFFSSHVPARKETVNLNTVVEEGLYFLKSRCAKEGIAIRQSLTPGLPKINADPSQIHQVIVNLVVNAIQAMVNGGELTITTASTADNVSLVVQDTGAGMSEETLQKMFIPFFTTKEVGQGTGLGLSVVHGIVTAHGGTIKVKSAVNQGSRFEIRLPITTDTHLSEGK